MNNAEIFSQTFGIYATEMWAMPESEFLSWLNSLHDVNATNTTDTISRQAAIDAMATWDWQEMYLPIHFKQLLEEVPSAERKGHWIKHHTNGIEDLECSECGCWFLHDHLVRDSYCPNCGADMRGEQNDTLHDDHKG